MGDDHQRVVLLVEDEALIRLPLVLALEDRGFSVIEASSGDQALTALQEGLVVDLVISDVQMPGSTNGIALADHVRSSRPDVPVVLTSGRAQSPMRPNVPFLFKPLDPDRLADLVEWLLGMGRPAGAGA